MLDITLSFDRRYVLILITIIIIIIIIIIIDTFKMRYRIFICFTHPTSMSLPNVPTKMKFVVYLCHLYPIIMMVDKNITFVP